MRAIKLRQSLKHSFFQVRQRVEALNMVTDLNPLFKLMVEAMNTVMGHREIYNQAASLRTEVQAELVLSAFAFFRDTIQNNVPAFGPLSRRANYKLCMKALKPQPETV